MLELIARFFAYLFGGEIAQGIFGAIFKGVYWIGLISLKLITFSKASTQELKVKYKDSSKPYFLGFGFVIGIFLLINGA